MSITEKHAIKHEYWKKNIEKYSGFYYVSSEENINIPFGATKHGFKIVEKKKLETGFILELKRL